MTMDDEIPKLEYVRLHPLKSAKDKEKIDLDSVIDEIKMKLTKRKDGWSVRFQVIDNKKGIVKKDLDIKREKTAAEKEREKEMSEEEMKEEQDRKARRAKTHKPMKKYDLEITIQKERMWELLNGEISLFDAFHNGILQVRAAKIGLGREFFESLIDPMDKEKLVFMI